MSREGRTGRISRRRFLARSAAALLLGFGCEDDGRQRSDGGSDPGRRREAGEEGAGDRSPGSDCGRRILSHRHGRTVLESAPERVVSLTERDQDSAVAVGVVPAAIRDGYYRTPYLERPWVRDAVEDAEPVVIPRAGELPFERIAALEPDLILATASGISGRDYGILSRIAPTVAQPADFADYGVPWEEVAAMVGRSLCREERTAERTAGARGALATARREHPELEGATVVVALPGGPDGSYWVYGAQDTRVRFLSSLGMTLPEEVEELSRGRFSVPVSAERMDLLDADVLVWLASPGQRATLEDDPVYRRLPVAREGRDLFLPVDGILSAALTNASVLSVPYIAQELPPRLAAALSGSPGREAGGA